MATFDALELLLSAKYIGAPAFRSMARDVEGLVTATSGLSRAGAAFTLLGNTVLMAGAAMAVGMAKAVTEAGAYDDAVQRMIAVGALHTNVILTAKDAHDSFTASLIANKNELQAFNAEVAASAIQYGIKPTDVASGSYFLYSALPALKISAQQALGYNIIRDLAAYTRASGPAGAGGGVTFAQAAQDLPRLFSGYNTPIQDWGGSLGIMTFLENNAHMTQTQLVQSMSKFLPAATALRMGFPDAATLMAALASSGVYGSRAGTEASSGLVHLFGGTAMASTGLASAGIDTSKFFDKSGKLIPANQMMDVLYGQLAKLSPEKQLAAIHDVFGLIGMRAFGGLLETGMGKYNNLLGTEKALGIYGNNAQAERYLMAVSGSMMNAPGPKFQSLMAALQLLGITVGNKLTPFVMKLEDALTSLILKFDAVVASSHTFGQFIGNLIGMFTGHSSAAHIFSAIGGAMSPGGGGGGMAMLGMLGSVFGTGIGLKGLGGVLGWAGKIDSGLMRSHASGLAAMSAWEAKDPMLAYADAMKKIDAKYQLWAAGRGTPIKMGKLWTLDTSVGRGGTPFPIPTSPNEIQAMALKRQQMEQNAFMAMGGIDKRGPMPEVGPANLGEVMLAPFKRIQSTVADFTRGVPGQLKAAWTAIGGGITRGRSLIGNGLTAIGDAFTRFHGLLGIHLNRLKMWQSAYGFLPGLAGYLKSAVGGIGSALGHLISGGWSGALSALANGFKGLGGFVVRLGTSFLDFIPELIGFAAAAAPVIAVVLLLAGIVTIAIVAWTNFRSQVVLLGQMVLSHLIPVFNALKAMVGGAILSIVGAWNSVKGQVIPAVGQFLQALMKLGPVLDIIGGVIIGVVAVALGLLVGAFKGVIAALPYVINFLTALVNVFAGEADLIMAIIHGQWGKIPGIVGGIIGNLFSSVGSALHAIVSLFGNFVGGVLGWFDMLTGGALTRFGHWLQAIPGEVGNFIGNVLGAIGGFATNVVLFFVRIELGVITTVLGLWQRVSTTFQAIVSVVTGFASAVTSTILGWLGGIAGAIGAALAPWVAPWIKLAAQVLVSLGQVLHRTLTGLGKIAGAVVAAGERIWAALIAPWQKASAIIGAQLGQWGTEIGTTMGHIGVAVGTTFGNIGSAVGSGLGTAGNAIGRFLGGVGSQFGTWFGAIGNGFDHLVGQIEASVNQWTTQAAATVINFFNNLKTQVEQFVLHFVAQFLNLGQKTNIQVNQFTQKAGQTFTQFAQGLNANAASMATKFVANIGTMVSQAVAKFTTFVAQMVTVGSQMVTGFIQGVQSQVGRALGAVGNFFVNIVTSVKNFLGIKSPSMMFMGIGQDSAQGYINGIQSKKGQAVAASTSVANAAAKAFASPTNLASAYGAGEDIGQALADGTYAAAIQANIGANINAAIQGQLHGAKGGTPHFAAGGTVPYTGLMTVGEHGKEMVMLPRGARVFNHSDTMAMLRPGEFGPHRVNPDLGFIQHGQQTALFGPHQMQVPHDFYDRIREAVASGHQQAQGSTNQAAMRTTMQQARQIQSLREALMERYDRRSDFDDQYRYAVQYTQ